MIRFLKSLLMLTICLTLKANAQIQILDTKKLNRIKDGETYVLVRTTTFPGADKFLQAMQKDWTLTRGIHYLPVDNATITLKPNDSFFSLESLAESAGGYGMHIYFFLNFWTCKENYYKKSREMKQSDHEVIAQVALSVDGKVAIQDGDFDGGGKLLNWSPGMVHNYLQQITSLLNANKKKKFQDDIKNKDELALLKNEILFVPDFDLITSGIFTSKQEMRSEDESNSVFERYTYAYKVITKNDLDNLIFTSQKPVYYLLFIKHDTNKIVCVINGKTGETVYSEAASLSTKLKSGDVKSLFKAVSKS